MDILLRSISVIGIVFGLLLASYVYWEPGIQQSSLISQYQASPNKDAFDLSHPDWRREPDQEMELQQLVNIVYGLGIAIVSTGLLQVSHKIDESRSKEAS